MGAVALLTLAAIASLMIRSSAMSSRRAAEIDALCADLGKTDIRARDAAVKELSKITDTPSLRRMAMRLGDADPNVGETLPRIFENIGAPAVEPVIEAGRKARNADMPLWLNRWLRPWRARWLGLPSGDDSQIEIWCSNMRVRTPIALSRIGPPARPALLKMIAGRDIVARGIALESLIQMHDPEDFDLFMQLLRSPDTTLVSAGAEGLGPLEWARENSDGRTPEYLPAWKRVDARTDEAVTALVAALNNSTPYVAYEAALALGYYQGNEAALAALIGVVDDRSRRLSIRAVAVASLSRLKDLRAREAVIGTLSDPQPLISLRSAEMLPKDEETARMIAATFDSTDVRVRQGAAAYFVDGAGEDNVLLLSDVYGHLGEEGRETVIAALTRAVAGKFSPNRITIRSASDQARIQQSAKEALEKIRLQSSDARSVSN